MSYKSERFLIGNQFDLELLFQYQNCIEYIIERIHKIVIDKTVNYVNYRQSING